MITASVLLDRDFALGTRRGGVRDKVFRLLVLEIAEGLTSFAHLSTVLYLFGGRKGCFTGSTSVDGTSLVCVRACPITQTVPAELKRAFCAYKPTCQPSYKIEAQAWGKLTKHVRTTAVSLDSCPAASRTGL
jgi:hypothetical protein